MDLFESPSTFIDIKSLVIIGFVLILLLAILIISVFIIHTKKVQTYQNNLLEIKSNYEKAFISIQKEISQQILDDITMELHDNISHHLVVLKYKIEALFSDESTAKEVLNDLNEILINTKNLSMQGGKLPKLKNSIIQYIQEDIERINKSKKIMIQFELEEFLVPDNDFRKLYIYRVYQELITNILKHSRANRVKVRLTGNEDHFILSIEDDGIGFDTEKIDSSSSGLEGIRSKCKLINGTFQIESIKNKGTLATLQIPLKESNALINMNL
jgi:two-component system, NarL family, sensor kinase